MLCGSIKVAETRMVHIATQIAEDHNTVDALMCASEKVANYLANTAVTAALYGDSTSHGKLKDHEKILRDAMKLADEGRGQ